MLKPINAFWDLILFRLAPQDLPASRLLLQLALGMYFLADMLVGLLQLPFASALWYSVADTAVLAGVVAAALRLRGHPARTTQTLTAAFGGLSLLTLIAYPVIGWSLHAHQLEQDASLPVLINLVLLGWSIAVLGHILRHALSVPQVGGLLLSIGYLLLWWQVSLFLFPPS